MEISYSIQVVLQQETKSCSLTSISFLELLKNLRECFYEFDEKIIQYIDDEGDLVVFSTTEELELALKLTPNNLRIVLQKKSIPVPIPVRWIPKDKRPKKRPHEDDLSDIQWQVEDLHIDEIQRNKKFCGTRNPSHITAIPLTEPWPSQFQLIFIDGNNLMFLSSGLRKLTLQKRFRETERAITAIVESFAKIIKITAILMFDETSTYMTKNFPNGSVLKVTSARPASPTTDQALIGWGKSNPSGVGNTIAVTSDRALTGELKTIGMSVCKPSSWFKFVMKLFSTDEDLDYRIWIDTTIGNL